MSKQDLPILPNYTVDFGEVKAAEAGYLAKRRAVNNISEEELEEGTWGICFSSGGIGSSIQSLGLIRSLIKENFLRRIDYMSSVSSGSLISACLSSLLTDTDQKEVKFDHDKENSPFVIPQGAQQKPGEELSAVQQLSHLKQYRCFVPEFHTNANWWSMIGVWFQGYIFGFLSILSLLFFAVVFHGALLQWFSNGQFLDHMFLQYESFKGQAWTIGILGLWAGGIGDLYDHLRAALFNSSISHYIGLIIVGILYSIGYTLYLNYRLKPNTHSSIITKKAGRFLDRGLVFFYIVFIGFGLLKKIGIVQFSSSSEMDFWFIFFMPLVVAFGMLVGSYMSGFIFHMARREASNFDELKDAIHWMNGVSMILVAVSIAFPILYLLLTLIGGWESFGLAVLLFLFGIFFTIMRARKARLTKNFGEWSFRLLSNIAAIAIVLFLYASMSRLYYWLTQFELPFGKEVFIYMSLILTSGILVLFYFASSTNRSNLHHYLKSKLVKGFLTTEGLDEKGNPSNLRNDALLKMHELGQGNFSGPYHIIQATINLHHSKIAGRYDRKGLPFTFSKYYTGSPVTNYVKTEIYQEGKTKLIDAVANSMAILNPGMGIYSFAAQSYLLTSLNLRLGAWIENPLYYTNGHRPKTLFNYNFLNYIKTFMGRFDARSKYINLTEGDHCGDNFGLIPLIQRECAHIILCDFTVMHKFFLHHDLFDQTLNLAKNYGVEKIDLDRDCFKPASKNQNCETCVQFGTITYSSGKTGKLYYLKSVLYNGLPEEIIKHKNRNPQFPNTLFSSKNFSDADYEAYLNLGEKIGLSFLAKLKKVQFDELLAIIDERLRQLNAEIDFAKQQDLNLKAQKAHVEEHLNELELQKDGEAFNLKIKLKSLNDEESEKLEKISYLRTTIASMVEGAQKFQEMKALERLEEELDELRLEKEQIKQQLQSIKPNPQQSELVAKIGAMKGVINRLLLILRAQNQFITSMSIKRDILVEKKYQLDLLQKNNLNNPETTDQEIKKSLLGIQNEVDSISKDLDQSIHKEFRGELQSIQIELNRLIF